MSVTTHSLISTLALALLCCGAASDAVPPRAIFLLVVDALRADHLSCQGAARQLTPHIDTLAEGGVRFARAHAAASWTVPSMASLFASRWPRELGLLEAPEPAVVGPYALRRHSSLSLDAGPPLLAERLRAAGYRTAGFVDQPLLDHHSGFARGFDDWFHVVARGRVRRFEPGSAAPSSRWEDTPHAFENDAALVARFERYLAQASPDAHLFAWLHLLTPHTPYLPPPEFALGASGGHRMLHPEAYAGEVRAVDALMGRALDAIERYVGFDHALVVFTSDHGEALGDHGSIGHGHSLHAGVMQVPLLMAGAGLPAGVVVEEAVRLIDIAPTILELAGAETPASFRGASLWPRGGDADTDRPVFAEGMLYGPSEQALVANGYKLLLEASDAEPKLFALAQDPQERTDVSAREPDVTRALRARLDALRGVLDAAPSVPPASPTPRDREALEALGYLEAGAE